MHALEIVPLSLSLGLRPPIYEASEMSRVFRRGPKVGCRCRSCNKKLFNYFLRGLGHLKGHVSGVPKTYGPYAVW